MRSPLTRGSDFPFRRFSRFIHLVFLIVCFTTGAHAALRGNPETNQAHLKITLIDVWQGDCILLELPNGKRALIDTGEGSMGMNSYDSVRINILPYLKRNKIGITNIHYLLLTHPHTDHIGGAPALLDELVFKEIYDSGMPYPTKFNMDLAAKISKKGLPYKYPKQGEVLNWDSSVRIRVLNSGKRNDKNPNNSSIVLHLTYGTFSFLLTGDAEKKIEEEILDRKEKVHCTVLKAGHHGSKTSSSERFLHECNPQEILVSVGLNNKFNLPSKEILDRYKTMEVPVWRTDNDGDLRVITDGKTYRISAEKDVSSLAPFPIVDIEDPLLYRTQKSPPEKKELLLSQKLNKGRNDPVLYDSLSRLAEDRGDLEAALLYARAASGIEPLHPTFVGRLGILYFKMGKFDKAIPHLQQAASLKKDRNDSYFKLLASCYISQKEFSKAAEAMTGRLWSKPWDDTIYVDTAWLYTLAGDNTNATKMRKRAGAAMSEYDLLRWPERNNFAWNAYKRKEYLLAATNFLKVAHILTNEGFALMMAGKSYWNIGEPEKSERLLRSALLRKNGQAQTHIELAKVLEELRKPGEALTHYYLGLSSDNRNTSAWESVAKIHARNKEFAGSTRAWLNAFQTAKKGKSSEFYIRKSAQMACEWASQDPAAAKKVIPQILNHLDRNERNFLALKKFMEARN